MELLVSVTLTLLLVLAVVQAFDLLGNTIQEGRSKIDLAGSMRNATDRLQRDLDAVTCPVEPWIDPDAAAGYFEYYEGPRTDQLPLTNSGSFTARAGFRLWRYR